MTKFADDLYNDLMREHGPELAQAQPPAAARRRVVARPLWLGAGTATLAAGAAATALVLGGSPAYAAYSVTPHSDGTVTVSVNGSAGVAGANATLHRLGDHVVVVPVRAGCPPISSLPHPPPGTHPRSVSTRAGISAGGHRSVSVKVRGLPAGTTLLLAFSMMPKGEPSMGAGGLITGKVPHCVSLPALSSGRPGSRTTQSGNSGSGQAPSTSTG